MFDSTKQNKIQVDWDSIFPHQTWTPRILVVDDNPNIHEDVKKVLSHQKNYNRDMEQLEAELFGTPSIPSTIPPWKEHLHIDSASQGEQAVAMLKQSLEQECPYFLVFVDIRMPPGIDGIETIKRLWAIQPDLYTVICSAYSDFSWSEIVMQLGPSPHLLILQKPFDACELLQVVYASMQKYAMALMVQETQQNMETMLLQRTRALQTSEKKAEVILSSIFDGILLLSENGTIEMTNPSVSRIFGYDNKELVHRSIQSLILKFPMQDNTNFVTQFTQENPVLVWEDEGCRKDNKKIVLELGLTTIHFHNPDEHKWLCICRDITERKKAEERLAYAAYHDQLTRLPNRDLFHQRLDGMMAEKESHLSTSRGRTAAVFFLDLDQFKGINDTLGHQAGDLLLQEVSSRLLRSVRNNDMVARFGGDEFAILLDGIRSGEDVLDIASRIQQQCRIPIYLKEQKVFISCSIGIVPDISSYRSSEDLLRDADIALYQAKGRGRDCYQVFDAHMYTQVARFFQMEMELRQAIEQQQFENEYQAIVDLKTGHVCGFEALVRWNHPECGRMNPGEFIPLAEEKRLISTIGEQVLNMACQQLQQWKMQFFRLPHIEKLSMNVNYSAEQLVQPTTVSLVQRTLERWGISPSALKIEITESVLITHTKAARNSLCALKELGVSVVLDDFGTGYSSLSYLHSFPIDQIKLDRSFIHQLNETSSSQQALKFLDAIIKMAHVLDLSVVAEGIETEAQHLQLKGLQCEWGQGYYFSPPQPAQHIELIPEKTENICILSQSVRTTKV